ncbi:MAG: DsbE family thiol:disulfide interchange protein [Rhodospirillales bacterium]|jgi:cytochrome c biogenesis protein CcmG/thiol:disulfide interchange protein DsbE|nr:DsbE family thiol:disulfide interchange protein [Rhodospirillales bacterium]
MKRLLYFLPLAVFAVLAIYFALGLGMGPKIIPSALIDKPVPQFTLPPIAGGAKQGFSDADLKGGVSVINVFASWCIPCKAEHPFITKLAGMGVATVYGLNYKDEAADALQWLANLGDPYHRIGADRDGRAGIEWGVYGVPETFIVDAGGRIRHKQVGPLTQKTLNGEVLPIIRTLSQ